MFFMPELLTQGAALAGVASSYDSDALAYFNRMSTQENSTFKTATNQLVLDLKTAGLWSIIDRIYWAPTALQANSLYDLKSLTDVWTIGGTCTFTASKGWKGDGSTGYIDSGKAIFGSGLSFTQNNASYGVWCNGTDDSGTANHPHFGSIGNGTAFFNARVSAAEGGRVNSSTDDTGVWIAATRAGFRLGTRLDNTTARYSLNGAATTTASRASALGAATNVCLLRRNTLYSNDQVVFAFSGGGMNDTQIANLYTAVNTALTALGAN